jgi:hypothetical protein
MEFASSLTVFDWPGVGDCWNIWSYCYIFDNWKLISYSYSCKSAIIYGLLIILWNYGGWGYLEESGIQPALFLRFRI